MRIYHFATFGRLDRLPAGGGQTSARRMWHTLESLGYEVQIFNRHRYYWFKEPLRTLLIGLFRLIDPVWMFTVLLFKRRSDAVFLFQSYAGGLVYFDFMMTLLAKLAGHKTIMYLKGGQAEPYYRSRGKFYRLFFRCTMRMHDMVWCEGMINVKLADKLTCGHTRIFYLPNYTENGFAPPSCPEKPKDVINICYFGRICAHKQVMLTIDIFNQLCAKYDNLTYTIVGGGNAEYVAQVEEAIMKSPYKEKIKKLSRSSHELIAEMLREQHLFLFPSCEPCEGHSNALNEAMSWGVVPIVSSNNFLPDIVGDPELVVAEQKAENYVSAIAHLINLHLIPLKSRAMYERVQDHYTQSVVEQRIISCLRSL